MKTNDTHSNGNGHAAYDVVIAGGGPGGSICAARLADHGRRVLVVEKERFPRFHLGESLLPQSMPVLGELGLMEQMHERFIVKRGACFHDCDGKRMRYDFAEAFDKSVKYAFQVPRDEFDEMLLRRAERAGAEVREGWTVVRVVHDEAGRAVGVEAKDPEGKPTTIAARFVVDATGRDALFAHATRTTTRVPQLDKTALYSHFTGAWRDEGERAGDIQIIIFPAGWFWFIPFKDGRTSVGVVVSSEWMRTRKPGESVDDLYKRAISESPVVTKVLAEAKQLFPAGAAADFSFRVRELAGEGWITVGDAGGFIDPLFSTGAHLAMYGGMRAADILHAGLDDGDLSPARFASWSSTMRRGGELFLGSVQAFYGGTLHDYLFTHNQHPFLRHAITSMLAGDVFSSDARWTREMASRFPAAV